MSFCYDKMRDKDCADTDSTKHWSKGLAKHSISFIKTSKPDVVVTQLAGVTNELKPLFVHHCEHRPLETDLVPQGTMWSDTCLADMLFHKH